jgi:hypothetical protein
MNFQGLALLQMSAFAFHLIDRRNWARALIKLHVDRRIAGRLIHTPSRQP